MTDFGLFTLGYILAAIGQWLGSFSSVEGWAFAFTGLCMIVHAYKRIYWRVR